MRSTAVVDCPYAEKSDTLILCAHAPEETGAKAAWRGRDSGKIITMPFFCFNKCVYYRRELAKGKEGK